MQNERRGDSNFAAVSCRRLSDGYQVRERMTSDEAAAIK